jgi:hypothetical protein
VCSELTTTNNKSPEGRNLKSILILELNFVRMTIKYQEN